MTFLNSTDVKMLSGVFGKAQNLGVINVSRELDRKDMLTQISPRLK
jgi:hypothetical protein